jgi:DNA-directed RNA polymerase sigma subunit (sigma70/sigma32)
MREALTDREQTIIEMRYGLVNDPLTQREVAAQLNISRSYVSRIEKRALEKLKKRDEELKVLVKRAFEQNVCPSRKSGHRKDRENE